MKNQFDPQSHNPNQVFWVDVEERKQTAFTSEALKPYKPFIYIWMVLLLLLLCSMPILMLWEVTGPIPPITFIAMIVLAIVQSTYQRKRLQKSIKDNEALQASARRRIDADTIGSAVHVAGHPRLERHQPVVLALKDGELSFYSYQSPIPLNVVPVGDITAVHTVVYDADRIPHIEVLDDTAQALQLVIKLGDREATCLLRRFRYVRAIDWAHELQKAQFQN